MILLLKLKEIYHHDIYGIRLSHIFEIPSNSNEKPSISIDIPSISIEVPSISIEVPSISIKNLGFRSKY